MSIVTREAYAEAFRGVTGRPLVKLTQANGRPDSEIVFEMLAINGIVAGDDHLPGSSTRWPGPSEPGAGAWPRTAG